MNPSVICPHPNAVVGYRYGSELYVCPDCHLVFQVANPTSLDAKSHYQDFYKNEIASRFQFKAVEKVVKAFRFFRAFKIRLIDRRAKKILDVGSGRGFTLYFLKKYCHFERTAGTQLSRTAYEFSKQKLGLEIYHEDLLQIPFEKESFDLVTMWHVLEHVAKPQEYVQRIHELLSPGGKLIIEVPNFDAWTRIVTKKYWLGLDLENHLNFFTVDSLSSFLKRCGFAIRLAHNFSLEYSVFFSAQSLVSFFTQSDQLFFKFLQGEKMKTGTLIFHLLLFIILSPLCLFINLGLYFSRRGEVLLVVAEKTHSSQAR